MNKPPVDFDRGVSSFSAWIQTTFGGNTPPNGLIHPGLTLWAHASVPARDRSKGLAGGAMVTCRGRR